MAKPPTPVSTATPSEPVDAIGFLQARFDAGATQDELEKIAAERGIQINAAQLAEGIRYRDEGGKGASFLPPAPLLPEAQAEVVAPTTAKEGLTGTVTDERPFIPEEPTALQAAGQSLADYYANEPIGLDPNFLRQFGAMPGEFAGPDGLFGAVSYAALAPLNLVRRGVLEPLEAGFQSLVTGGAQGLANIPLGGKSALQRLGDVFIPGVKATPEGLTRDITDAANIAGLFAGANPSAVMPRLGRVSPTFSRASRVDMPEAPIVAEAPAASRIAEVAAPVTPPPAPTITRPRISTPETPAAIPVAEADVARAVSTLEKTAEQVADEVPLVDQAGNINLSKLETGDDVKRLIDTVAQTNNEFIEARRGVLPVEEVNKLADKVDLESIVARPIGQAFNAEQIVAARRAVVATAEDVFEKARRYAATGDQNLRTEALEAVLRQAAFQEQLAGATAEAGRALRMLREVQGAERSRAVETLVGQFTDITDPAKVDELLEKISTLNSPEAVAKFVGEATKPGFGDKVTEFWINGLLMSPTTHAVNVTSNALTSLMDIPEKALASAFGTVLRSKDRITLGELGARTVGMFQGTRDGLRLFKEAIRTGEAADNVRRVEFQPAIGGRVGRVVRTPTRLLTAQDELFKAINGRAELAAQAYKKAKEEAGGNAELFNETYRKYMESPTKDMTKAAEEHARLMTFQAPLGKWGQAIQNVTNKVWPTRFIAPFITTPTNIVKHALRRSPLAPLGRELWKDITAGGRARDEALARVTLGSGVAGSVAALASQGLITGGGPEDPKQKAALLATGWQPYSFKIGDTYYQYGRLEPLAMTVGMAADYATLSNFMTEKDLTDAGVSVTLAIAKNLTSKTYLQGISDFMEMFSDPERYGESYIQNFIASFTPNILGATARSLDPAARDVRAENFFEETKNRIQSRIPGLSDNLPEKLDVWGDPVTRTGAVAPEAGYGAGFVYNILSPVKVSKQDTRSSAKTEVARLNMVVGYPDKNITIAGEKYPLPVELHRQFGYASGQMAKTALDEIVNKAAYKNLSDEDKRDLVKDMFKMSRDYYRDAVIFEYIRQHNEKVDRGEK